MKKLKKAMAIFVSFVLLAAVCIMPVYALGGLLGSSITDLLGGLLNGNAGNNENEPLLFSTLLQNPGGILDALRERLADYDLGDVSNTDLVNALSQLLNGDTNLLQDLLNGEMMDTETIARLAELLGGIIPSTTEEPTTLPTTTSGGYEISTYALPTYSVPSTNPIVTIQVSTVYSGADPYSTMPTMPTTQPAYSSEAIVTMPTYSEAPISSATYDVSNQGSFSNDTKTPPQNDTGKIIAGAAIVAVALAAVIVVAIMLKKSKV